jgi:hypothetical protein
VNYTSTRPSFPLRNTAMVLKRLAIGPETHP